MERPTINALAKSVFGNGVAFFLGKRQGVRETIILWKDEKGMKNSTSMLIQCALDHLGY
jgi:hypothetical protein